MGARQNLSGQSLGTVVLIAGDDRARNSQWKLAGITLVSLDRTGKGLRQALFKVRPNWVILGETWDDTRIRSVTVDVQRAALGTKITLLGWEHDLKRCERWIRSGVACYLVASSSDERIIEALNLSDRQNIVVIDACFQDRLVELTRLLEPQGRLSDRELQLLTLAGAGLRTDEIAADVHLTGHTVEFHFRNIASKLGARNRTQAVARAVALGIITLADAGSLQRGI